MTSNEEYECDCRFRWFEMLQPIALCLIFLGVFTTWLGDHWNYPELKTLGAGVAGAGIQKITSTLHQSSSQQGTPSDPAPSSQSSTATT